ncbi:MAG TPA: N-acetyltransferase, partial [Saprospiraceae bacterium]|nr:N-acetyltransferase [Saprospiraceae bacterium]
MILQENDITLRPYTLADATALAKIANTAKIADNLRDLFPHPYTIDDAKAFIQKNINGEIKGVFAIIYKDQLVGSIGIHLQPDVYRKTAELGYFVAEKYWNKGIASKSIELITKYGFESLHLTRIFAGVFQYNKASMRVLEKNGYILE